MTDWRYVFIPSIIGGIVTLTLFWTMLLTVSASPIAETRDRFVTFQAMHYADEIVCNCLTKPAGDWVPKHLYHTPRQSKRTELNKDGPRFYESPHDDLKSYVAPKPNILFHYEDIEDLLPKRDLF